MIPIEWVQQAHERIAPYIVRTPLMHDAARDLYIKWENRQVTGSFKARGAFNKMLMLEEWEREVGIVAASAGNHGQGLALAGRTVGAKVEVFVSENAVPAKVDAMRKLGAVIHTIKGGYPEAEAAGKAYATKEEKTWVSPYNDGQIIAGQGTVGLEVGQELNQPAAAWLVPVSGGGLIAGIGSLWQASSGNGKQVERPRLVGVQAEASPFMHSLFYHATQEGVSELATLADGLAGAVENGSVTIPMVKQSVDEIILVSENEITRAVAFAWYVYREKIEASGAVGLAAVLAGKISRQPAVVIVSGGNIQPEIQAEILEIYRSEQWL